MKKFTFLFILTAFIFSFKSLATTYTFTGNGNWTTSSNWQGGIRPPYDDTNTDTVIITGTCSLAVSIKYNNDGLIWVKPNGVFTIQGGLGNYFYNDQVGTIRVDGIMNNNPGFSQEGTMEAYGTVKNFAIFGVKNDLLLHASATFENSGEVLFGPGKIICEAGAKFINTFAIRGSIFFTGTASVTNNATISPGNSPGTATISGDYTAGSTAIHNFEVAGTGNGQYDKLVATGTVTLNGTLNVTLLNGYTPQAADNIPLFTGSAINGTFTTVNKPSQYQLVYNATSVMLRNISTLPVTFSNVDVKKEANGLGLTWKMQNEFSLSHYEIERSENGVNFRPIGQRVAASLSQYSFTDALPDGKAFYRIKAVDNDGKYSYSVVVMYSGGKTTVSLRVFPSPAKSTINVQHAVASANSRLVILSVDGKMVQTIFPANGAQTTPIDLSTLKAGSYFIRYYNKDGEVETAKFIKQ